MFLPCVFATLTVHGAKHGCVIHSRLFWRVCFDFFSVFVLIFDLLLTPVILAWEVQINGSLKVVNRLSLAFWSIDMVLNFSTGFFRYGEMVMERREIAKHYVGSYFILDISLILSDIIGNVFTGVDSSGTSSARLVKIGRLFRVTSFSRLARQITFVQKSMGALAFLSLGSIMTVMALACGLFRLLVLICSLF